MTTSGTVGKTVINVAKIIDHAFRRAGLSTTSQTAENIISAKENLYFYLSNLGNGGVDLWTIEKLVLGTSVAQANYQVGVGTIDLKSVLYRTINTPDNGTAFSSAGGTVNNAFDQDITTYCTQNSTNGYIAYTFSSAIIITNVAIMTHGNQTYDLTWDVSDDGVTWTTVLNTAQSNYTDRQWSCYDINSPINALWFRVKETGGGTLDVRELGFNTIQNELTIARMNFDMYSSLTTKTMQTTFVTQYWFNRLIDNPEIIVWPIPSSWFYQIVVWKWRQIQDVGALTNTIEVPQRWIEAIVTELACRLILEVPGADLNRLPVLQAAADKATLQAQEEERDKSPIMFAPNVSCYTR